MKVLISDSLSEKAEEIFRAEEGIEVVVKTGMPKEELLEEIKDFNALIVRSSTIADQEVIEAGKKHNTAVAIQVPNAETGIRWKNAGIQMISITSEMDFLTSAAQASTAAVREG